VIRIFDILLSLLFIIFTLPLMVVIGLLILCCNGWPVFYISKRVGRYNRQFSHLKFRTMKKGKESGRVFFEQERITSLGKVLRKLHLDELPELFLILKGTLSLVGPRPLPEKLLTGLNTSKRAIVRPGWTGLAQIYLTKKGKMDKRLQIRLDNYYVDHRDFFYNMKIIMATICVLLHQKKLNMRKDASKDREKFNKNSTT